MPGVSLAWSYSGASPSDTLGGGVAVTGAGVAGGSVMKDEIRRRGSKQGLNQTIGERQTK